MIHNVDRTDINSDNKVWYRLLKSNREKNKICYATLTSALTTRNKHK